jgi:hypothetical protein
MHFGSRPRIPLARKAKGLMPLSVGRHAFVDRAPSVFRKRGAVILTDQSYTRTLQTLVDGEEVEILGWRQHPSVHYNVRCVGGGAEGWVAAECLRGSRNPVQDPVPGDGTEERQSPSGDGRQGPAPVRDKRARAPIRAVRK